MLLYVGHRGCIYLLSWGIRKELVHLHPNFARAVETGLFGARSASVVAIVSKVQALLDALTD